MCDDENLTSLTSECWDYTVELECLNGNPGNFFFQFQEVEFRKFKFLVKFIDTDENISQKSYYSMEISEIYRLWLILDVSIHISGPRRNLSKKFSTEDMVPYFQAFMMCIH